MDQSGDRTAQVEARKAAFLTAFALTGNVSEAARRAYVTRTTPYGWAKDDPDFKAAWDVAEQEAIDALELEARRRAELGVSEPVYQGGELVGHKQVYSDSLMSLLLKAHRPDKYRERQSVEMSGPAGGPIETKAEVDAGFVADALRFLGYGADQGSEAPSGEGGQ